MLFKNAISWFEIPVQDMERARVFYETIFTITMIPLDMAEIRMCMFPLESPLGVGGSLCYHKDYYRPSATDGPLIYLNANPDVQHVLDKIGAAGGQILVPKTQISPEHGFMAIFIDTEGNRMALHSIPG
jgi:predicted enzyme related to lactoylglutathione lyase